MMQDDKFGSHLDEKRDNLDKANDDETKQVGDEITRIKAKYVKKHGLPKETMDIRLPGITPPKSPQA